MDGHRAFRRTEPRLQAGSPSTRVSGRRTDLDEFRVVGFSGALATCVLEQHPHRGGCAGDLGLHRCHCSTFRRQPSWLFLNHHDLFHCSCRCFPARGRVSHDCGYCTPSEFHVTAVIPYRQGPKRPRQPTGDLRGPVRHHEAARPPWLGLCSELRGGWFGRRDRLPHRRTDPRQPPAIQVVVVRGPRGERDLSLLSMSGGPGMSTLFVGCERLSA